MIQVVSRSTFRSLALQLAPIGLQPSSRLIHICDADDDDDNNSKIMPHLKVVDSQRISDL